MAKKVAKKSAAKKKVAAKKCTVPTPKPAAVEEQLPAPPLVVEKPTDFNFGSNVVKCLPCEYCHLPVNPAEIFVALAWGERKDGLRHLGRPATKVAHNQCDRDARGIKPREKKATEESSQKPVKATGKTPVVRQSSGSFDGLKLYKKVKDNPRKPGTHGHKSFSVITDGMTFEKYISLGGRRNDLAWDVEHNWVEVR